MIKVRYHDLAKNTAQLSSLFGLANLLLAKRYLQQWRDNSAFHSALACQSAKSGLKAASERQSHG